MWRGAGLFLRAARQMDPHPGAVGSSAREYLAAAESGDYAALWRLMSRGAQAIVVATARAEGLAAENGPAALERLMKLGTGRPCEPGDVAIEVVSLDRDVAQVMISSPSRGETDTLRSSLRTANGRPG